MLLEYPHPTVLSTPYYMLFGSDCLCQLLSFLIVGFLAFSCFELPAHYMIELELVEVKFQLVSYFPPLTTLFGRSLQILGEILLQNWTPIPFIFIKWASTLEYDPVLQSCIWFLCLRLVLLILSILWHDSMKYLLSLHLPSISKMYNQTIQYAQNII